MRKRFAILVMSLTVVAVVAPAAPASATTCYVEDPVEGVQCMIYNDMLVRALCVKLPVC